MSLTHCGSLWMPLSVSTSVQSDDLRRFLFRLFLVFDLPIVRLAYLVSVSVLWVADWRLVKLTTWKGLLIGICRNCHTERVWNRYSSIHSLPTVFHRCVEIRFHLLLLFPIELNLILTILNGASQVKCLMLGVGFWISDMRCYWNFIESWLSRNRWFWWGKW